MEPKRDRQVNLNNALGELESITFSKLNSEERQAVKDAVATLLLKIPAPHLSDVFEGASFSEARRARIAESVGSGLELERMTGKELMELLVNELGLGIREIGREIGRDHTVPYKLLTGRSKQARPELMQELRDLVRRSQKNLN